MKIIEPSHEIMTPIDRMDVLRRIELAGRTCYKSEDQITEKSAIAFVAMVMKRGHESVIEHVSFTVKFICDRGVTHELVRHRLCAFSQESTRYCNYGKADEITVVNPPFWNSSSHRDERNRTRWNQAMAFAQKMYLEMVQDGIPPQEARSVLPNSLKTEIVTTANLREWRHILRLRTGPAAHPQIHQIMLPLLAELKEKLPEIYGDLS